MKILKNKKNLALSAIISLIMPFTAFASSMNIEAVATNTVAGYSTIAKTTKGFANVDVNFALETPAENLVTIPAKTDSNGIAQVEIYDYHLKVAGEYCISAYYTSNLKGSTSKNCFEVFPGEVNPKKSNIYLYDDVVSTDGDDYARISVKLVDDYENPVKNHALKLISSREVDIIEKSTILTSSKGEANFIVTSVENGISHYSVMDTTENILLVDRVSVSYQEAYIADAGGDFYINTAYAQDAGPLDRFVISGIPDEIEPGQNISFTVTAVDADGITVKDFNEEVRFASTGDGVKLPPDYKFEAEDQGTHTFDLGVSFTEAGTYTLSVAGTQGDNRFVTGEIEVLVGNESEETNDAPLGLDDSVTAPRILTPAPGTYSIAEQTITGTAQVGATLKVYDNNLEIGTVPVGSSGNFSFQTPSLAEGEHEIYVNMVDIITNEVKATSNKINITIDTSSPQIEQLDISPETGITSGDVIEIKLYSEPGLSQAVITFNAEIVELRSNISDATLYEGEIQAPATPGDYPIDVILVDELGNEITFSNAATVTTTADGSSTIENSNGSQDEEDNDDENQVEPEENESNQDSEEDENQEDEQENEDDLVNSEDLPSQVRGLNAYGSDNRVTLVWDAATDNTKVENYKIYYGDSIDNLENEIETLDASPTWYIPDLENGKEYFFAVTAIDDEGNESQDRSSIVSGIPFIIETNQLFNETEIPSEEIGSDDESLNPAAFDFPEPVSNPNTGPGVILLLGASAAGGILLKKKK